MTLLAETEHQLVEQPAIGLFAALGWQMVSAMKRPSGALGRETRSEVAPEGWWAVLGSKLAAIEAASP